MKSFFVTLPLAKPHSIFVISIILLAVIAHTLPDELTLIFEYHHRLITQGEYWRLFTGHLLHTNTNHLLLNLAGIVLLWLLHGRYYSVKNTLTIFLFSAFIISLGLYIFSPELIKYVGLSGVLHGIFVWGAMQDIQHKVQSGYLLFLGVIAKVIYEQLYGSGTNMSELIGANVAIDAHLWGVIAGIFFFIISIFHTSAYFSPYSATSTSSKN